MDKLQSTLTCRICGKPLVDAESMARRIGPDCYQHIMQNLERATGGNHARNRQGAAAAVEQ